MKPYYSDGVKSHFFVCTKRQSGTIIIIEYKLFKDFRSLYSIILCFSDYVSAIITVEIDNIRYRIYNSAQIIKQFLFTPYSSEDRGKHVKVRPVRPGLTGMSGKRWCCLLECGPYYSHNGIVVLVASLRN